jgi:hypothetical protein
MIFDMKEKKEKKAGGRTKTVSVSDILMELLIKDSYMKIPH